MENISVDNAFKGYSSTKNISKELEVLSLSSLDGSTSSSG